MEPEPVNHKPTSSTADIVAEAQRRQQTQHRKTVSASQQRRVIRLNRAVLWLSYHWLALFNLIVGLYMTGAILPPIFMKMGYNRAAQIGYAFYDVACHQYPFRSWFLFGQKFTYPLEEPPTIIEMNASSHFVGNETVGYKVALCQRDMAIYGIISLAGVWYGVQRKRHTVAPLPIWLYFIFGIMPIMLDGGIQWLSEVLKMYFPAWLAYPFETIPAMRVLTGALFGAGIVAATYPIIDEYFVDIQTVLKEKLNRIANNSSSTLNDLNSNID
ncbi:MAG: DUF2085 domain-containing protein [Anaerolineae bacterium]|nr:DUF2085 domain-containing protein [Anaerolineae bacterium]